MEVFESIVELNLGMILGVVFEMVMETRRQRTMRAAEKWVTR